MLSFILLLWFALCVIETVFDYASNSALSLVAVCRHVLRISLPAFVLALLFAHNVVMIQYDASGFCGHVALNGSHAGLS